MKLDKANNIDVREIKAFIVNKTLFKSNNNGNFIILNYENAHDVEIKFVDTGFVTKTHMSQIKKGKVKDKLLPSVYGVGVIGDKYPSKLNGNWKREYSLWSGMLCRCHSSKLKSRQPSYEKCQTSNNFNSYTYFHEWCHEQAGFNDSSFHLDKDLLIRGNKTYSEDTCVFIPHEINLALIKRDRDRGKYPIGVYYRKRDARFAAQINTNEGMQKNLGYFSNELDAFHAYKQAKESYLKELAEKHKQHIDIRAYDALMSYEITIND